MPGTADPCSGLFIRFADAKYYLANRIPRAFAISSILQKRAKSRRLLPAFKRGRCYSKYYLANRIPRMGKKPEAVARL